MFLGLLCSVFKQVELKKLRTLASALMSFAEIVTFVQILTSVAAFRFGARSRSRPKTRQSVCRLLVEGRLALAVLSKVISNRT